MKNKTILKSMLALTLLASSTVAVAEDFKIEDTNSKDGSADMCLVSYSYSNRMIGAMSFPVKSIQQCFTLAKTHAIGSSEWARITVMKDMERVNSGLCMLHKKECSTW